MADGTELLRIERLLPAISQATQQPRVDLVGLAGQRGEPLELDRVGDLHRPAAQPRSSSWSWTKRAPFIDSITCGHRLAERAQPVHQLPLSMLIDADAQADTAAKLGVQTADLNKNFVWVQQATVGRDLGFIGAPYVNVLQLNLALDRELLP